MNRKLTYSIALALFLLYFLSYSWGLFSYVLFYHEQHHLFLFTEEYFTHRVHTEGLLAYLTDFLIQFFYYPPLGGALLASLLTAVYLLTQRAFHLLTGRHDVLQLAVLPSFCLFLHTMYLSFSLTWVVGTFIVLLVVTLCLRLLQGRGLPLFSSRQSADASRWKLIVITGVMLVAYGAGGFYYFYRNFGAAERIILLAEKAVKEKDWEQVLRHTDRYLGSGRTKQLMLYFHNLALCHTGKLPYCLFDHPQTHGAEGLYIPWTGNIHDCEYGHFLYEDLGRINEAQHWSFEAMVVWGENAPHLINLARYNIVNHRPLVAQRFINKLKQSLFYREEALRLERLRDSGEMPGIHNADAGATETLDGFIRGVGLEIDFQHLSSGDANSRMKFEYGMSNLLLCNRLDEFAENLPQMKRFSYPDLPRAYEEALHIYKMNVSAEEFAKCGFTVSEETEKRYLRYLELVGKNQSRTLWAEFRNTYWFYKDYICPYGRKVNAQ